MSEECSCPTFTLAGDSYTVYLSKPEWGGAEGSTGNVVELFDFWDDSFDVVNRGIDTEPLSLRGTETLCGDNVGLCVPYCVPWCFAGPLCAKFEELNEMMDSHEEITVTGLGECIDGVYVISGFDWGPVRGSPYGFWWRLEMQYVREN